VVGGGYVVHGEGFVVVEAGSVLEGRHGAAPKLLRALRGDINEEKAAGDGGGGCLRLFAACFRCVFCLRHDLQA
jgi:hypothetical protein